VTHDDAEYFSKLAGSTTVYSANRSASRPLMLPWADRGNRGMGEAQRALITPDELRTMRDEVFIVAGDRHPIRARQRRYYDDPALARRVPNLARTDPLVALFRAVPLPVPLVDPPLPLPVEVATVADERIAVDPRPEAVAPPPIMHVPDAPAAERHAVAPLPSAASALPSIATGNAGVVGQGVALTPSQRRLLVMLAAMPTASSTQLAAALGVQRSTVRDGLMRIRRALGIGQEADIVATARTRGALPPVAARTGAAVTEEE